MVLCSTAAVTTSLMLATPLMASIAHSQQACDCAEVRFDLDIPKMTALWELYQPTVTRRAIEAELSKLLQTRFMYWRFCAHRPADPCPEFRFRLLAPSPEGFDAKLELDWTFELEPRAPIIRDFWDAKEFAGRVGKVYKTPAKAVRALPEDIIVAIFSSEPQADPPGSGVHQQMYRALEQYVPLTYGGGWLNDKSEDVGDGAWPNQPDGPTLGLPLPSEHPYSNLSRSVFLVEHDQRPRAESIRVRGIGEFQAPRSYGHNCPQSGTLPSYSVLVTEPVDENEAHKATGARSPFLGFCPGYIFLEQLVPPRSAGFLEAQPPP